MGNARKFDEQDNPEAAASPNASRPLEEARPWRRLSRLAGRSAGVISAAILLLGYALLRQRLGQGGTFATIGFHAVYVMALVAVGVFARRYPDIEEAVLGAFKFSRILTILFAVNCVVLSLIIVSAFTQAGLLAVTLAISVATVTIASLASSRRSQLISTTLQSSPVSFVVVYLLLGIGEVYLRFHPLLVGGGGGGNPALANLYAGLGTPNSLGLRGAEVEPIPRDGTIRILALGDSYTFGQGVALEQTYPWQLEQVLNTTYDSLRFEVLNAGQPGKNATDHLEFLRDHGLSLKPRLVTVQFYLNDLQARFEGSAGAANQLVEAIIKRPFRRSYVIFFLRWRFDNLTRQVATPAAPDQPTDWIDAVVREVRASGPGWRQHVEALTALGSLARDNGLPAALILFPPMVPDVDDGLRDVHRQVARVASDAGLRVIDLTDAFRDVPAEQRVVSEIDYHPSALVYEIAGREIAAALQRSGLFQTVHD